MSENKKSTNAEPANQPTAPAMPAQPKESSPVRRSLPYLIAALMIFVLGFA